MGELVFGAKVFENLTAFCIPLSFLHLVEINELAPDLEVILKLLARCIVHSIDQALLRTHEDFLMLSVYINA